MPPHGSKAFCLSIRVCLCLSIPLSFSLDHLSLCLVCVCHSSCWSSFLKRAILTCWRSINMKLSAWPGQIVSSLKWAGLYDTLWENAWRYSWKQLLLRVNHLALRGNVQEIVDQHYTLHLPEDHKFYQYFHSLHKLFLDHKQSLWCHLRTSPLMTSRSIPPLAKLVHTKRNSDPAIWSSIARSQDFISISFSIQLSHLFLFWPPSCSNFVPPLISINILFCYLRYSWHLPWLSYFESDGNSFSCSCDQNMPSKYVFHFCNEVDYEMLDIWIMCVNPCIGLMDSISNH